ncbi:uncharacterized protein Tco025E_07866 [Trypanosoma conorhini]|uniref:Trypanosoma Tc-38 (p38) protein domain-containing protein n=1 Tax=Trypanosoma conorhini TaxID=83891 RepID=A0A3S5IR85_9TRYP|nr:uncharacterized protein Tco025E_07866 [Trypanosoma conorhini]RNF05102.1 hypothetical protein Tco025E_07866 [Trypanosoma conorhini]
MRQGFFKQPLTSLTVVEPSIRGISSAHSSSLAQSTPRSFITGERYSQRLETQLMRFGRQMKFNSPLWITEKQRKEEGLQLRSVNEIPFCPPSTERMESIPIVVNAAFVEETDLFFFFMRRPLPVRGVSSGQHWIYTEGQWSAISPSKSSFPWMEKLFACVNCMLLETRPPQASSQRDVTASLGCQGREVKSRMRELILPPSTASGRQPEFFWIDHTAVVLHGVALFTDAAWFPLNAITVDASCMYNMEQVELHRKQHRLFW